MKNALLALTAATLLGGSPTFAEDANHHDIPPGPNGGRMLDLEPLHAEFLLNADHTVTVTLYAEDGRTAVAPTQQAVTVIAETPSGKMKLDLVIRDGAFRSTEPLPEGEGFRIVVQVRDAPDAKPRNIRFDLVTHACADCDRPEYACTCNHAE